MAQSRNQQTHTYSDELQSVFAIKARRKKARNDNDETRFSGMTFRAARLLKRREADLNWQIRFSRMKLRNWQGMDDDGWTPLQGLLQRAEAERIRLS